MYGTLIKQFPINSLSNLRYFTHPKHPQILHSNSSNVNTDRDTIDLQEMTQEKYVKAKIDKNFEQNN